MEAKGRKSLSMEESSVLNATEVAKKMMKTSKWLRLVSLNQFLKGEDFFLEQHNNVMPLIKYQFDFHIKKNIRYSTGNLNSDNEKTKK